MEIGTNLDGNWNGTNSFEEMAPKRTPHFPLRQKATNEHNTNAQTVAQTAQQQAAADPHSGQT